VTSWSTGAPAAGPPARPRRSWGGGSLLVDDQAAAIEVIRQAYPAVHACGDALSGALMNAGPVIHPPLMVMNAAPSTGPMVVFGAATGLRPAELVALEQRDLDRAGVVVYVRRQVVRGQVKQPKTRRSIRAVPLQAAALEALDLLPEAGPLLFPAAHGGHIDLHNFRARHWRPAQIAAGIDPVRRPYDLRHTYATFALRAGISIFDLSRFMGASLAMIDRHYGHLARDGRDHAVALLDAYARDSAAWTSGGRRPQNPQTHSATAVAASLTR